MSCLFYFSILKPKHQIQVSRKVSCHPLRITPGKIWLSELNVGDSTFDPSIAMATYEAGAKLDWHSRPGGQVLLITEGAGYYQERGKPARVVRMGDVIQCAPGVEHWHGATPNSGFAYLAVTPTQKGKTIWLEPVSDKDYNSAK